MALSLFSLFLFYYVWFKLVYEDRLFGTIMRALLAPSLYHGLLCFKILNNIYLLLTSNFNISLFYQLFFANNKSYSRSTRIICSRLKMLNLFIMKTN